MSVNIDGMFLVAQRVGKQLILQGQGGAVIQTSSIYGLVAPDPRIYEGSNYLGGPINTPAVYAASKAAIISFTRSVAIELRETGVRINCFAPGPTDTPLWREGRNPVDVQKVVDSGLVYKPEEFSNVEVFGGEA